MKNIRPVACAASVENEGTARVDISDGVALLEIRNMCFNVATARGMHHHAVARISHAI